MLYMMLYLKLTVIGTVLACEIADIQSQSVLVFGLE